MSALLQGKTAIVTGAARGIGKGIAARFLAEGATVVLCDRDKTEVALAANSVDPGGSNTLGACADVTQKRDVEAVVEETLRRFGKVDILVNNAGIFKQELLVDMKEEDWDSMFGVNVKGYFLFSQAVGKVMMRQRSGRIINVSSCSGKKADLKQSAYNASKAAILGLNRVLALEIGPYGVNVNAICPGATDTEMIRKTFLTSPAIEQEWINKTALKRLCKPDDVAKVAVFLSCDLSDHITGEALIVSGAETMSQ